MTNKDNDNGGPAFPGSKKNYWHDGLQNKENIDYQAGMSLRDWYAGMADIPWNATLETLKMKGEENVTAARVFEYRAELAFLQADAMIKAREKGNG